MSLFELGSDPNSSPDAGVYTYADVAVPRSVPMLFTYRVPESMLGYVVPGVRVVVQLGKKQLITGVVRKVHQQRPQSAYVIKDVLDVLDEMPLLNQHQLALHDWMADYYMCPVGDVVNAALPAGFKISSESRVQLYPGFDEQELILETPEQELIIQYLHKQESASISDLQPLVGNGRVLTRTLKELQAHKAVIVFEQAGERYVPKKERRLRIHERLLADDSALDEAAALLDKAPAQHTLLMTYLKVVPVWENPEANLRGLSLAWLLQESGVSDAAAKGLVQKGIMEPLEVVIPRYQLPPVKELYQPTLSTEQLAAFEGVMTAFQEQKVALLHGVTGSGKTEIYIKLVQEALHSGQQALILLPEIALTAQMVGRLHSAFGQALGVYHSRFSDNERVELWQQLHEGRIQVVLGVRSAVFLPFSNLGLVVVDEEHDTSYKQHNPAPRYHGRDVAIVLAKLHGAQVILGSATPALDSYYKAKTGKWKLVELQNRFGFAPLPKIQMVDLRLEKSAKTMVGPFTSEVLQKTEQEVKEGRQAIYFQNRRGYAPQVVCQQCAAVPECPNCDVSLTYHQRSQDLRCHYCGHKEPVHKSCHQCGSTHLITEGYGTEQIEDQLTLVAPHLRIKRMDQDTTRGKNAFQKLVEELEQGQVDVLVGTQMVAKGFDFKGIGLVAIFDIDRFMHQPHYRAKEVAFQLMTQVAGRAGRHSQGGTVLIQTINPGQPLLGLVAQNDYGTLYRNEMLEREKYFYPPFCRLIEITLRHADGYRAQEVAYALVRSLTSLLPAEWVLGPSEPQIARIRNLYHRQILIKLPVSGINLGYLKSEIRQMVHDHAADAPNKGVEIALNVDPLS